MTITDQQKKAIYAAYVEWSNQVFDDLEDKGSITADELVYKVLEITERHLEEINQWRAFLEKDLGADE